MVDEYLNTTRSSLVSFQEKSHTLESNFLRVGLILLYSFIFLICFFGNLAVILVVSFQWKKRSVSKYFLWNMAVANFSVSVFGILQHLTLYLLDTCIFGELMCKIYHFISNLCHTASILMVVLISIERYVVLLHSLKYRQILTARTLVVIILGVWTLSAGISLPRHFHFSLIRIQLSENGDSHEICVPWETIYNSGIADVVYFLLLYLVPLAIISVLYLRIGMFLRQSERLRRGLDAAIGPANVIASFSETKFQLSHKNLTDLNGAMDRPIRAVLSAPEELETLPVLSDAAFFSEALSCCAQAVPQHKSLHSTSLRVPGKSEIYSSFVVHFECSVQSAVHLGDLASGRLTAGTTGRPRNQATPYLIEKTDTHRCYEVRSVGGRFIGNTTGSSITANSSSMPQWTKAVHVNMNATRVLYRYNRSQLHHIRSKQRQMVVRLLIFTIVSFAILNLPYHLCKLWLYCFDLAGDVDNIISPFIFALRYANCALNPILYAFISKSFRASLRDCRLGRRGNISTI